MIGIINKKPYSETYVKYIALALIIAGIILAFQYSYGYFVVTTIGLAGLLYSFKLKKDRLIGIEKQKIKEEWGNQHKEKRSFVAIKDLYDFLNRKESVDFIIDDITWRDLNMDEVFSKVDHTKSFPGMQYMYNFFRKPVFNEAILKERNDDINKFLTKKDISIDIQYLLSNLGKKEFKGLFNYFTEGFNIETKNLIFYRIFSILPIIGALTIIINRSLGFFIILLSVATNGLIYQRHKDKVYSEIDIFKYIGGLMKTSNDILNLDVKDLNVEKEELKDLLKTTKKIYKNVSSLNISAGGSVEIQMLIDYINLVTLRETIIFYSTIKQIDKYKNEVLRIYEIIGKIDAYIALASYKDSLDFYTEPVLEEDLGFIVDTKSLYHPLLKDPVPYSFILDNKGALVTGSNASGKSTYVRAIGINSIFAQTFYTVLAKDYRSSYFRLLTSIGTTDSISLGDSYFMAEAKSLKRIIDMVGEKVPVLCILDEIFRGTNTIERISSAKEVLNYMVKRNTMVVAATHDLELTSMVNESFHNFHFKESIEKHDISFDYILRDGPATSRNAIAILRYLGYPEEIYESADETADQYEVKDSIVSLR